MSYKILLAAAVFFSASLLCAQEETRTPKTTRQIVFGLSVFDGGKYLSSFVAEDRKEMRLSAGFDHVISVLLSDVYYWPITAEYRADFQGVNIPLKGRLELFRGEKRLEEFTPTEYIYYFPHGREGEATRLLYGQEKVRFLEEYVRAIEEYKSGKRAVIPRASIEGPFNGYLLNLKAGKYRLVYSAEKDGRTFSMEKKLVVFVPKKLGLNFQIIPEEKWTVSSASETPRKRIYLKPGAVVFLKSFPARLYDRADYELMTQPHRPSAGIGMENSYIWVREEQSLEENKGSALTLRAAGLLKKIRPSEFAVVQTEGSALGYSIVEYDETRHASMRPAFSAYRIPAPPAGVGVTVSLDGRAEDSIRYLRSLNSGSANSVFWLLLLPLPLVGIKRFQSVRERRRALKGHQIGNN